MWQQCKELDFIKVVIKLQNKIEQKNSNTFSYSQKTPEKSKLNNSKALLLKSPLTQVSAEMLTTY